MPTKAGRRRWISALQRAPAHFQGRGVQDFDAQVRAAARAASAAREANASGGQKALAGLLKGQSGRGGRTKRNSSFMAGDAAEPAGGTAVTRPAAPD